MSKCFSPLKIFNMALSIAMYLPLWWRILERGTSGDISLWFQSALLTIQVVNLCIAVKEKSRFFTVWYGLQTFLVTASFGLVRYYHD